jgi:hypothetical protein
MSARSSAVNYHPWFVGCLPGVVQLNTISGLWDVCQGSTVNYHPLVCGLPARSTAINYHPLVCGMSARSSAINYQPLVCGMSVRVVQ